MTCVPKKTHQHFNLLYNQKTNLSSKFRNPATLSLSSLWNPISPKSNFSLFLVSSPWNLKPTCSNFQFKPPPCSHTHSFSLQTCTRQLCRRIAYPRFLSFFHPPLHCTVAIPKYPWSTTIKSYPHLIFHTNIFFFFQFQTYFISLVYLLLITIRYITKTSPKLTHNSIPSQFDLVLSLWMGWDGLESWNDFVNCDLTWAFVICDQEGCFGLLQLVELLKMCFELGFDDDW